MAIKLMSIKNQKILRFIPVANFLTLVFWGLLFWEKRGPFSTFFKNLAIMFGIVLIITLLEFFVIDYLSGLAWLYILIQYAINYFRLLAISVIAVRAQEELLKDSEELS